MPARMRYSLFQPLPPSSNQTMQSTNSMNVVTEESPLMIYVENSSRTTWEEGVSYRLYGDAYGMYDSKPWLVVRYAYGIDEY